MEMEIPLHDMVMTLYPTHTHTRYMLCYRNKVGPINELKRTVAKGIQTVEKKKPLQTIEKQH